MSNFNNVLTAFATLHPNDSAALLQNPANARQQVIGISGPITISAPAAPAAPAATSADKAKAIAAVAFDVIALALSLLDVNVPKTDAFVETVATKAGEPALLGFESVIKEIGEAYDNKDVVGLGKSIFELLDGVHKLDVFDAIWDQVKEGMSWWDWAKTGLVAAAQFTAWFATDGVAFVAEVALVVFNAVELGVDIKEAISTFND